MLERSVFHSDREPPKKHKSGWSFQTFRFEVEGNPELENGIEIRACDLDHALKQAKTWGKRDGFTVVGLK